MLDNWLEQLRRGGLELAILLVLSTRRAYGLQIIRELEEGTDLVVTEGTVYPILGRLTRDGVLAAEWENEGSAHPRKYYGLTATGRARLADMVAHWDAFARKIDRLAELSRTR
jgi:PadR family transcriptional regulator PadR